MHDGTVDPEQPPAIKPEDLPEPPQPDVEAQPFDEPVPEED